MEILLKLRSEKAVAKLEKLLREEQKEQFQEDFKPKTIEQLNEEIDLALKDSAADYVVKSERLLEKYKEWD